MNKFVWISSYPKSGNTWLRYLISNYFFNKNRSFDYKIISSIKKFPVDDEIEKIASKEELKKYPYNIAKYWIKSQELMEIKNGNLAFLKNHNALVNINENELTNEILSLAAIYILRDPRDVVISYSYYNNISFDKAIEHICSKELRYSLELNKNGFPRIEILGSWKFNYLSWKNGIPSIPKLFIKYEDLLENSYSCFYKVISFLSTILNFEIDEEQLKFSLNSSTFKTLNEHENKLGFYENDSKNSFFRSGKSHNWIDKLNNSQLNIIENEFNNEMKFLGYL